MFTTLPHLKSFLDIDTDNLENDQELLFLIKAISGQIRKYCNRDFSSKERTEQGVGIGRQKIWLKERPILEVKHVAIGDPPLWGDLDINDYIILAEEGALYRKVGWYDGRYPIMGIMGNMPSYDFNFNYMVTYTAGYIMPGDINRNLPEDLEYACLMWCQEMFNLDPLLENVASEKLGSYNVQYRALDYIDHKKPYIGILNYYRTFPIGACI